MEIVEQQLRQRLWTDSSTLAWLEEQLPALEEGGTAPFAVADQLRARSGALLTGAAHRPPRGLPPDTQR
jgi:LAO/AO transport system kinase